MPSGSEINRYLDSSAAGGSVDSSGEFTLAAKEAIRKLAKSLLPYRGAWAVKIIQAIVAGGTTKPITVNSNSQNVSFSFSEPGFSLDELFKAYFNPHPSSNRSLAHLVTALRSVGMGSGWEFWVYIPNQNETLVWNGQDLKMEKSKKRSSRAMITVLSKRGKTELIVTSPNYGVEDALSQKCYMCPVSLIVNLKFLDCLQKAEFQGWSEARYPVAVGAAKADLPSFGIPPGSCGLNATLGYYSYASSNRTDSERAWQDLAAATGILSRPDDETSIAYVLSVHMQEKPMIVGPKGKSAGPSKLYWVLDGAVLQVEDLFDYSSFCSVGCFISAQGLATDLSGLRLIDSPDKDKRRKIACAALASEVPKHACLNSKILWYKRTKLSGRYEFRPAFYIPGLIGLTLGFTGLGLWWLSDDTGTAVRFFLCIFGLVMIVIAAISRRKCIPKFSLEWGPEYEEAIKKLADSLLEEGKRSDESDAL